jgi:hypothetical protein
LALSTAAISHHTAANEIATRVHEFIDMPKESIPGEEITGTASTPARPLFRRRQKELDGHQRERKDWPE